MTDSEMNALKSSVSLKQEVKCNRIIDFIRISYTVYGTTDGRKFDTLEDAQVHSRRLKFREMIGVKSYEKK